MDKRALERERRRKERVRQLAARKALVAKRVSRALVDRQVPEVSCTYILQLDDGNYKIGGSQNLRRRVIDHAREMKLPLFVVYHAIESNAPHWAERYLHSIFRHHRVRGEVYALQPDALAWLRSLQRLDRDNEPTPPAFNEPVVPLRPAKVRATKPKPERPQVESPPSPTPKRSTKNPRKWRRGRFPTVWHP